MALLERQQKAALTGWAQVLLEPSSHLSIAVMCPLNPSHSTHVRLQPCSISGHQHMDYDVALHEGTAEEGVQMCSSQEDKERVLSQMIFPNCERLGQTIIFVQRRETGRRLHSAVRPPPLSPCLPRLALL